MRYAIDPTKIHNELGWLPETKFEDGIKRQFSGILITVNGGKQLSVVNIRTITKKCTVTDNESFSNRCCRSAWP